MRARAVADGQQVDIPVLQYDRTVGTRKESCLLYTSAGKSAVDKNMSGFMRMKKVSDIWA